MTKLLAMVLVGMAACAAPSSDATQTGEGAGGKADGYESPNSLGKGTHAWSCHERGRPDSGVNVQLTHQGTKILEETVDAYQVISGGELREESDIGDNVFDVVPSGVSFLDTQQLKFRVSLQDYSDVMSWTVFLQATPDDTNATYFGVMMTTYSSSDGDGYLHPSSFLLECTHQTL